METMLAVWIAFDFFKTGMTILCIYLLFSKLKRTDKNTVEIVEHMNHLAIRQNMLEHRMGYDVVSIKEMPLSH